MSLRCAGLAVAIPLMFFGCTANPPAAQSSSRLWDLQKERQQQAVRQSGRIGYIGNDGSVGL